MYFVYWAIILAQNFNLVAGMESPKLYLSNGVCATEIGAETVELYHFEVRPSWSNLLRKLPERVDWELRSCPAIRGELRLCSKFAR